MVDRGRYKRIAAVRR